jgi:spermidine/putrescine-binding protein
MLRRLSLLCVLIAAFAAPAWAQEKILNVFNWNDYIAKDTLEKFTAATGIKVNYDVYDGNEILEAKLLAGKSGYDVVFPSTSPFFAKQVLAGIYRTLDKTKLPNLSGLDPTVMAEVAKYDPGNAHGVPYLMAGTGVGYNVKKVRELMPDAPLGSLAMVFDPNVLQTLKGCGVTVLDSPEEVLGAALAWLGKDPISQSDADLKAASDVLMKARPTATPASCWATRAIWCSRARAPGRPAAASTSASSCPRRAPRSTSTSLRSRPTRPIPTPRTPSSTSCSGRRSWRRSPTKPATPTPSAPPTRW